MLVSLSTACLYVYPLRKIFGIAREAGFDGVELVIAPEVELRGTAYVRELAREFSLPIFSIHPPLFGFPGWSKIHQSIAPYFQKALAITRGVGAPYLIVHLPRARAMDDAIGKPYFDTLLHARRTLDGADPRVVLENTTVFRARDRLRVLGPLSDLRAFADEHDFPLTLDTAHVGTWDLDLLDSIRYFDGRVVNVHFSDLRVVPWCIERQPHLHTYFKHHQFPGAGHLPLKEFLRAMHTRGYAGPITYELSPVPLKFWSPRAATAKLREAVAFVRAVKP